MTTELKKGGAPPTEEPAHITEAGVGFAHKGTMDGIPSENTANKTQFPGSKGELPGGVKTEGFSGGEAGTGRLPRTLPASKPDMRKSHQAATLLTKMSVDELTIAAGMKKQIEAGLLKEYDEDDMKKEADDDDLKKKITKAVEAALAPHLASLQKAAAPAAPQMQKGLVPVGEEVAKPSLEKSDQVPTYDQSRPSLEKALSDVSGPGMVLVKNRDGTITRKGLPTYEELANFSYGGA